MIYNFDESIVFRTAKMKNEISNTGGKGGEKNTKSNDFDLNYRLEIFCIHKMIC